MSLATSILGVLNDFLRRKGVAGGFMVLAYHPVVAELAAEIAASRRYRQDKRAGVEVGERFFADGVYADGYGFAVVKRIECAAFVFANQTEAH